MWENSFNFCGLEESHARLISKTNALYNVIFPETEMRVNLGIGFTFKSRSAKKPRKYEIFK